MRNLSFSDLCANKEALLGQGSGLSNCLRWAKFQDMLKRRHNTQLFALPDTPLKEICVAGATYRLVRVFKHDFFAATALYEAVGQADIPRIVVKTYRTQAFCGLAME